MCVCLPKKGTSLTFRDVLLCEDLQFNLLSASKLVDAGCRVVFERGMPRIECPGNKVLLLERVGNVFEFVAQSLGGQ